jgi:hypothetical protein
LLVKSQTSLPFAKQGAEAKSTFRASRPQLVASRECRTSRILEIAAGLSFRGLALDALDALDADAFREVVHESPAGDLAIIHEGLLMDLDDDEKRRLAASVHGALKSQGGAWITRRTVTRGACVKRGRCARADLPVFLEDFASAILQRGFPISVASGTSTSLPLSTW